MGATLNTKYITETIVRLGERIKEGFSKPGLSNVCLQLQEISLHASAVAENINKPIVWLRVGIGIFVALVALAWLLTVSRLGLRDAQPSIFDVVPFIESVTNEILLIAAGFFSLVTIETRVKRMRVVRAVNELRRIAHIIDMHQLTKAPDSKQHNLSVLELSRYLDYCSEMLSLVAKVGFIYVNFFDDTEASDAVNDLENLTTGLSRKIWQKIGIVNGLRE